MFFLLLFGCLHDKQIIKKRKRRIMIMIKNFVRWFITFGLSFLIAAIFAAAQQPQVFLYLDLGIDVLQIAFYLLILIGVGWLFDFTGEANAISLLAIFLTIGIIGLILLVTFGISYLFHLDFYVTYEVMTFIRCFFIKNKKN